MANVQLNMDDTMLSTFRPFKYDSSNPDCEPKPVHGIDTYRDIWQDDYVRMPCSADNITSDGTSKWCVIQIALMKLKEKCEANTGTVNNIKKAIEKCTGVSYEMGSLEYLINQIYSIDERNQFMSVILPKMITLAVNVDKICSQPPPLLHIYSNRSVTMSQRRAASLLTCAFFCIYPPRSNENMSNTHETYQNLNFNKLFESGSPWKIKKLKCILHYFRRITADNMHGFLQVDFANMYIGRGMMDEGCVQEDIRFTISTEMLVSLLVCEKMQSNECIFLIGCEQFSTYTGYANTFKANADYIDKTPKDSWGRKIVENMARELINAYTCFRIPNSMQHLRFGIATTIIQLIAASEANRPLIYATFRNQTLVESFWTVYSYLIDQQATVRHLCLYLQQYSSQYNKSTLFEFILTTPISTLTIN
ncbi:unnamed protein product [Adineta steineri]|uniref:PARG catalytic Macro domain-containing protein n=1 Tax=Adineta steineri TaxID=433720 RepID=A0A819F622_9BILA|nr:unnamed protein product [Adineta steineri]